MSANIGVKIRSIRKQRKMSARELASKIDLKSAQAVLQYERGEREPNLDTLKKIALALEVSLYDLIDIEYAQKENYKSTFNMLIDSENDETKCIVSVLHSFASEFLNISFSNDNSVYKSVSDLLAIIALYLEDSDMYDKDEYSNTIKDILHYAEYRIKKLEDERN